MKTRDLLDEIGPQVREHGRDRPVKPLPGGPAESVQGGRPRVLRVGRRRGGERVVRGRAHLRGRGPGDKVPEARVRSGVSGQVKLHYWDRPGGLPGAGDARFGFTQRCQSQRRVGSDGKPARQSLRRTRLSRRRPDLKSGSLRFWGSREHLGGQAAHDVPVHVHLLVRPLLHPRADGLVRGEAGPG